MEKNLGSRFGATTTIFKAFRTVGDTIFQAETFRVGPRYDASRSVGDNDDQDRYTDNTPLDPPALIIPGDLDKNNNGTFDRLEDLRFDAEIDGEPVSRRIRLRQIESANVRDMASAFILKTVYQFTKTIKITGGGQILLFNDMLDDENDFVRQALLAEMEKSFVAYEKDLFLHIGARYIDQRATGDLNDENFLETFVRVFGKF